MTWGRLAGVFLLLGLFVSCSGVTAPTPTEIIRADKIVEERKKGGAPPIAFNDDDFAKLLDDQRNGKAMSNAAKVYRLDGTVKSRGFSEDVATSSYMVVVDKGNRSFECHFSKDHKSDFDRCVIGSEVHLVGCYQPSNSIQTLRFAGCSLHQN